MFADRYIDKNIVYPAFISADVLAGLSTIVMIPCLNEPEIFLTLESLWNCDEVDSVCEIIVVVNNSADSSPEIKAFNAETYAWLLEWKKKNDRPNMVLHPIYADSVLPKFAGAGMARKIGMDEAIRRFARADNPEGLIISLDADCLVSSNYFSGIETVFADKKNFAATLNFKHRADAIDDLKQKEGILLYENYLHYYKKALDFTGFPDSIYTIGSAFVVRAEAYVKQGGMNRRQAGEDFYFLNKLTRLGKVTEINDVFVYPSGRVSNRVPFGTGAAMTKWMNDADDLAMTYNFSSFLDLKHFFDRVNHLFEINTEELNQWILDLPDSIQEYLQTINFIAKIQEINQNSSSPESFTKRFFQFFDALLILQFLNLAHQNYYTRQDLSKAISELNSYF